MVQTKQSVEYVVTSQLSGFILARKQRDEYLIRVQIEHYDTKLLFDNNVSLNNFSSSYSQEIVFVSSGKLDWVDLKQAATLFVCVCVWGEECVCVCVCRDSLT